MASGAQRSNHVPATLHSRTPPAASPTLLPSGRRCPERSRGTDEGAPPTPARVRGLAIENKPIHPPMPPLPLRPCAFASAPPPRQRPQPFSPRGEDVPSEVEGQMRGPFPHQHGSETSPSKTNPFIRPCLLSLCTLAPSRPPLRPSSKTNPPGRSPPAEPSPTSRRPLTPLAALGDLSPRGRGVSSPRPPGRPLRAHLDRRAAQRPPFHHGFRNHQGISQRGFVCPLGITTCRTEFPPSARPRARPPAAPRPCKGTASRKGAKAPREETDHPGSGVTFSICGPSQLASSLPTPHFYLRRSRWLGTARRRSSDRSRISPSSTVRNASHFLCPTRSHITVSSMSTCVRSQSSRYRASRDPARRPAATATRLTTTTPINVLGSQGTPDGSTAPSNRKTITSDGNAIAAHRHARSRSALTSITSVPTDRVPFPQ